MRVTEVDPRRDARWDDYAIAHPQGSVYHRAAWLDVLSGDYGERFVNLLAQEGDEVVGVLPLCRTRGLPLGIGGADAGARLTSLPRSPVGGPLVSSDEAAVALAEAARERARAAGVRLQLKPPAQLGDALDGILQRVQGDTSYVLELPDEGEELRFGSAHNHGVIRRGVGKAARSGVEIRPAEDERDLRDWYRLYLETMRRHVAPARPYRFFRSMWQLLRPAGMLQLLLAEQRSDGPPRMLAGCLFLMSGPTVVFAFNGRREEKLVVRPNDALHWHAIHEGHRRGFRRYDFGDVDDANPGLAQYKLKWGAGAQRLYRYHDPPLERVGARAVPGSGHAARMARAGWQRVPLGVTARVGDLLYRYI